MWHVVCDLVGNDHPRPTESDPFASGDTRALVVSLDDGFGHPRPRINRVGYARERTRNPDVSLVDQLNIELDKGRAAARVLNELLADTGGGTV